MASKPAKRATARAMPKDAGAGRPTPKTAAANTPPSARKPKAGKASTAKTVPGTASVAAFLAAVPDARQRADCDVLVRMMRDATGCEPVLWGPGIVGFDSYRYRYDSGREGEMPIVGFSPRKAATVLYLLPGFAGRDALLRKLGKHATGKSCLYVKRLADVDQAVLEAVVRDSVAEMRRRYPR